MTQNKPPALDDQDEISFASTTFVGGQPSTESIDLSSLVAAMETDSDGSMLALVARGSFGKLLQAMPAPIALVDRSQTVHFINDAFTGMVYDPDSLLLTPVGELFVDKDQRGQLEQIVNGVFDDRKPRSLEGLWALNGQQMWARINVRPLTVGKERSALVLFEDMTAEEREAIANHKYRKLVGLVPIGIAEFSLRTPLSLSSPSEQIFALTANATLDDCNDKSAELLGVENKHLLKGKKAGTLLPFSDKRDFLVNEWILKGFGPCTFETVRYEFGEEGKRIENTVLGNISSGFLLGFWLMMKDMSSSGQSASPAVSSQGGKIHIEEPEHQASNEVVTLTEKLLNALTEQKLAEDIIHEQNTYLGYVVDALTDPFLVVDPEDYSIKMANNAACEQSSFEIPTCHEIVFGTTEKCAEPREDCPIQLVKTTKRNVRVEADRTGPAGDVKHLEIAGFPIFDHDYSLKHVIICARDVTNLKAAEVRIEAGEKKLRRALEGTVAAFAGLAENRDGYTADHQHRVSQLAVALAEELGMSEHAVDGIEAAAALHDLGMVYVPAEVLSKPKRLEDHELDLIREHPRRGYEMLKSIEFPWPLADVVHQHHERMDGSGYPRGLTGNEICLEARILAVADVMEAMTSPRSTRPAIAIQKALEELRKDSGTLYDPKVVDACVKVLVKGFQFD